MDEKIQVEIECLISERREILKRYESLHDKLMEVSKAYEESVRKIPILIETALIAESKKNDYGNTSYGGASIEASYISNQEIDYQKQKANKLNNDIKSITQEIIDLLSVLLACDNSQILKTSGSHLITMVKVHRAVQQSTTVGRRTTLCPVTVERKK